MRAHNLSITGSLTVSGSKSVDFTDATKGVSGSFRASDIKSALPANTVSSSAQLSTAISGSFTEASSSFSTRITRNEGTGSSLTTDSGSFSTRVTRNEATGSSLTTASSSFSTRVTTEEGNVDTLQSTMTTEQTNIDNLQTDSGSFSTRVTRNEASASSLTTASSSFSTRMDNSEASGALMNQDLKTSASPTFVNVTATGTMTAQEFHTEFVSASIVYKSGSTKFGDDIDDTHSFTGSIHQSGSFNLNDGNMTIADTLTATNIGAFTAAGAIDFDSQNMTNVDINSGTVDAITSLTVANDVDVGNYKITSKALEASDLTAGRVTFAGANGLLADDSDLTFSTATLTATNITGTTIKDFSTISGSATSTGSFGHVYSGKDIFMGSSGDIGVGGTSHSVRIGTTQREWGMVATSSPDVLAIGELPSSMAMYLDNTGKVGIGTSSPDLIGYGGSRGLLSIASTNSGTYSVIELSSYQTSGDQIIGDIDFYNTSNGSTINARALIRANTDGAIAASELTFHTSTSTSATQKMVIKNDGKVGIGTTSPWEKLSLPYDYKLSFGAAAYHFDIWKDNNGQLPIYFDSSYDNVLASVNFRMRTDGTPVNAMTILGSGNVGIGITSPVSTLHVYENSTATDSTAGITIENAGTGDSIIQFLETGTQRWVVGLDNSDSDKFKISSDGDLNTNARLTIDTSGNATFTSGGDTNMYISDSVIDMYSPVAMNSNRLALGAGSAAAPSLTFQPGPDYDTGMYRTQADHIGFTTGGANALTLDSSQKATFAGDVTINGDTIVKSITANGDASTAASANGFSADDWVSIGSMGGAGGHRAKFLFYWNSLTVGSCCHHGYAILECGNMYNGSYNYGYDQYIRLLAQTHHNSFGIKGARLRRDGTTLYLQVQISGAPSAGSFTSYLLEKWGTATQVTPAADAYSGTITQTIAFPTTAEYADVSGYANNNGDRYFNGTISYNAASEYTPYPLTLDIAKDAILSHSKLPDGEYKVDDKEHQLDHSKLHDYLKVVGEYDMVPVTEDTKTLADQGIYETPEQEKIVTRWGRDSGATISCLVEVVKDLMAKVEALENA